MAPTSAALAPIDVLLNGVSHSGSWDYCVFRAIAFEQLPRLFFGGFDNAYTGSDKTSRFRFCSLVPGAREGQNLEADGRHGKRSRLTSLCRQ